MHINKSFSIANLCKDKKKIFRNLEKIQKTQVNVLSSISFNKALLTYKIYTKYLYFNGFKKYISFLISFNFFMYHMQTHF